MTASSGASLYYVSDKNIFDALNQARVDNETVRGMFQRRNIACSKLTAREDLAKYFSSLTHDFLDHQDISARLGMISRRERTTSLDISSPVTAEHVDQVAAKLAATLRQEGDVVHITKESNTVTINVKYTEIDYRKSEFRQLQHRDGVIEFVREGEGLVLRSTQSDHITAARDQMIRELGAVAKKPVDVREVSLYEYQSAKVRSKFFYDLMNELPGYVRTDVTDVYVHKFILAPADQGDEKMEASGDAEEDGDIQRVQMRGSAITRTSLLNDLLKDEKFYIFRIGWLATETLGKGYGYSIEALFHDAENCRGFTFLLKGVHPLEDGKISKTRRAPSKSESDAVARAVESAARKLMKALDDKGMVGGESGKT
jgi:hypothetical protein